MTLGERLKLVRGATSQRAFAAELGVHENSVSNAERRDSATQEYLLRIAETRNINLHWLLTGHGTMRMEEPEGSLLAEKLALALTDALRVAYGARYAGVPLDTRARALRAGATYLRAIGVTEDTLPDTEALLEQLAARINKDAGPPALQWIRAFVGQVLRLIEVGEIDFLRSDEKYTLVAWRGESGKPAEALIRTPLRELLEQLDGARFVQVHRSVVVNLRAISHVTRGPNETMNIHLKGREDVLPVSRSYLHLFRQM